MVNSHIPAPANSMMAGQESSSNGVRNSKATSNVTDPSKFCPFLVHSLCEGCHAQINAPQIHTVQVKSFEKILSCKRELVQLFVDAMIEI